MARTDALVLGAGIVGTSIALHLAKRGLAVALVDRAWSRRGDILWQCRRHRRQHVVAASVSARPVDAVAGRRSSGPPRPIITCRFLPQVVPWLLAYRAIRARTTAWPLQKICGRCSPARSPEHEALIAEAGAGRYLRKTGWLKVYRSDEGFADTAPDRELATRLGLPHQVLDPDGVHALEPALAPVFRHAIFWSEAGSISNPLAVTRAYAARFAALGGLVLKGDARSLHASRRAMAHRDPEGPVDAPACRAGAWSVDARRARAASACECRSRSSAAITGISVRAAMPALRGRWLMPTSAIASRRWSRGCGSRPAPSSRRAMRRQRRRSSIGCCRRRARCFHLASRSKQTPWLGSRPCFAGFAAGDRPRARAGRACGSPMAMPIGG